MTEKNYKLIYDMRPILEKSIVTKRAIREAQDAAIAAENNVMREVAKLTSIPQSKLKQTNDSCMANGVLYHIYHMQGREGSGKNKCVFCGCDDFID